MANRKQTLMALLRRNKKRDIKQQIANVNYNAAQERAERRKAIAQNRRIQKNLGNSKAGRALQGLVYGFNTNLAPASYASKAAKTGYASYTPSAAAAERGDTTKKTAEYNKRLEKSGTYKTASTVGGLAATVLSFIAGGGATRALGGKLAGTALGKAATKKGAQILTKRAVQNSAKKTLTRKLLERVAQNTTGRMTESAIRGAANKVAKGVVQNVAQDIATDSTIGLYRDLANARAAGVNLKDPKQAARYLGKQALINTALGTVTNGLGPVASGLKRNKRFWKVAETLDNNGKVHQKWVPKTGTYRAVSPKGISDSGSSELLSRTLRNNRAKATGRVARNLDDSSVSKALHNDDYVRNIRKNGINGKSVRQYASDEGISVQEAIRRDYDRYSKSNPVSTSNLDRLRGAKGKVNTDAARSTELSSTDIGSRVVSRRAKAAYDTMNPNETRLIMRNAEGRRVLHRVSDADFRRAAQIETDGSSIIANRRARLQAKQAEVPNVAASPNRPTQAVGPTQAAARQATGETVSNTANSTIRTEAGTPFDVTDSAGRTGSNAAEREAVRVDTEGMPDTTMGGRRTGTAAGRSEAADTTVHMKGNSAAEAKEIDDALTETGAAKKFTETNKEAIANARERIDRDGIDVSRVSMRRKYDAGERFSNEDFAESMLGLEEYRRIEREALAAGDSIRAEQAVKARDELASIVTSELSETGKSLQAARLFKKMSPEGRVNSVLMMKAKIERVRGVDNIKVDDSLYEELRTAVGDRAIQEAKDKIARQIWDQVPATLTEKLAAWRYMSMLFNPRTHVRNIVGNAIFAPVKGLKNIIGAGLERTVSAFKNIDGVARSKSVLNPFSKADNELIDFAKAKWDDVAETFLEGGKKYDLGLMRAEGSKIFKTKWIQKIYDANSIALNKEDELFAKMAYSRSYAQYLKANGIDPKVATDEMLDKAQKYAWNEALNSTYREANAVADAINRFRRGSQMSLRDIRRADNLGGAVLKKAGGTVADALVPFAKTPANIMRNGINYSPVGLIRGAAKIGTAKNADQLIKAIDAMSQGLTGTGIMLAGWWMASNGWVTGSIPTGYRTDEQRKGTYDMDRGVQEYAISDKVLNFDNKKYNATVDWAVPAAMPFFQGVELFNGMKESMDPNATATDKFNTLGRIITNMGKLADPVLNLSMLSSVENAFDTYTSSGDAGSGLSRFFTKTIQSRLGQYVPTLLGQAVKSSEENTKSASPVASDSLGNWEAFGRQQLNKIPGASRLNADKSDAFGNKIDHKTNLQDRLVAFAKNGISPANIKEVRDTKADREIQKLVAKGQPAKGLYPEKQSQSFMPKAFGDTEIKIGAKDIARFNEVHGQRAHKEITKLIKTKEYKEASAEERAAMIKAKYKAATAAAKEDLAKQKNVNRLDRALGLQSDYMQEEMPKKKAALQKLGLRKSAAKKVLALAAATKRDNVDESTSGAFVSKTLAATEVQGGVRTFKQAAAATKAKAATWEKVVNLSRAGFTSRQAIKFALTDKERETLAHYTSSGQKNGIDVKKLRAYIDNMNISRREKWARYEVNRPGNYKNPF